MKKIAGDLSLHFEGYGFVSSMEPGVEDVFIAARNIGNALHGDFVEAEVWPSRQGLFEGKIVAIRERGFKRLVGRLEVSGSQWQVVTEDARVKHRIRVGRPRPDFRAGDMVSVEITQYPEGKRGLEGKVLAKLPDRGSLPGEITFLIAEYGLEQGFDAAVEKESAALQGGASRNGEENRRDLRKLPFVTIDGEDAKDFDDAVLAEKTGSGFKLFVAIADVSYFVRPSSALDREAYERATSVYLPGRVLPMLPEVLSNDLCSLRPEEDRQVMVSEIDFDGSGKVMKENFYSATIFSHARLTYRTAQKIVDNAGDGGGARGGAVEKNVQTLSELARLLKQQRRERGSLDFDLPEPYIVLDLTGGIENIEKAVRLWSHQIIEECMIAANEAVARFLTRSKKGCVYRIHDGPNQEKLADFIKTISRLGFRGRFKRPYDVKQLAQVVPHFKGSEVERFVNMLLLRSMSQAVYHTRNLGHYGLGSSCYCHFTSPIRRYPDLIVHRLLRQAIGESKGKLPQAHLQEMATHCSRRERRSMEVERASIKLHGALFLREHLGAEYEGVISHVTKFGFFVELNDFFVEGLVPRESLPKDRYEFNEESLSLVGRKSGKRFSIGQHVRINVDEVKVSERRAFFKLLG